LRNATQAAIPMSRYKIPFLLPRARSTRTRAMNPSPQASATIWMFPAVEDRDDHQRGQVVDDREGEQVGADAIRQPAPDQGERAEGEGGVGGHRHPPAVHGGMSGVHHQEDGDGHGHAGQPRPAAAA
jgi:hypothetical protein